MARRVLAMRNLLPPFDLVGLASEYGDVEFLQLPHGADGITIGIGGLEKPKILINSTAPETRMKFTLAHEMGHVVIPWHTGTIVSHLDPGEEDFEYLQMESEANRFAAELLMPSDWLSGEFEEAKSIEGYFHGVLKKSGASKDAAFIKIFKALAAPIICAYVDPNFRLIQLTRSSTAPYFSPARQTKIDKTMFGSDNEFEQFEIDDRIYFSWRFTGKNITEIDPRNWREILAVVLSDTNSAEKLQSTNATMAAAFQKSKALSEPEICGAIIRTFMTKDNLSYIASHPLFEQYVLKRVKELSVRK
ncbi:MAG TPA: hypothetical protein DEH10_13185 [Pseudomonas sp.]|nr:hypothetical protein [Pseudomonas sp.]